MSPQQAALQSQATTATQQGQQLLSQDQAQAGTSQGDYQNYSNQANTATGQAQSLANYMQGAGSGANVYNQQLGGMEQQAGYNPQTTQAAQQSLYQLNGMLNGANSQFAMGGNTAALGGGASAGAMGNIEQSILQPLQGGLSNANTILNTQNTALQNAMTGANQATTSQVQTEQGGLTGLNQAAANYQSQAASALQNVQFFNQLAQQQGGLNASQQQAYANAIQGYTQAQAALTAANATAALVPSQQALNAAQALYYSPPKVTTPASKTSTSKSVTVKPTNNTNNVKVSPTAGNPNNVSNFTLGAGRSAL